MAESTTRTGVIGFPVAHSRSPMIHGYWLREHRIDGSYVAHAVAPEAAEGFFANFARDGWSGCNVTIPHKETAFRCMDRLSGEAQAIGAVNTVWLEHGKLCGTNTDAYGFTANLDQMAPGWDAAGKAVVLGAGGAARAIVHALLSRGIASVTIVNRTVARAETLASMFGNAVSAKPWSAMSNALDGAEFIVNTTSLGMDGHGEFAIDLSPVANKAVATDAIYVPLETPFLKLAKTCGLKTADGLGMLLHQAVPGFEIWFGVRPQVTNQLRDLIVADLEAGT